MTKPTGPPRHEVERLLRFALAEDLGTAGDVTTDSIFAADATTTAQIVAREDGRIAGLEASLLVFELLGGTVDTQIVIGDGEDAVAGATLAIVSGPTRPILTGERTCLNLLGHLSGIATATRDVVALVSGSSARVVDTRKTTPGLRAFEKYAVRCGGGSNHRFGLHDAVMIKDNHIAAAGSISEAVASVRANTGHMVKVEVEVDDISQIQEAIDAGADVILLDNMTPDELKKAVAQINGRAVTEASGGVTLDNVAAVASSGVDVISMGALTHSAKRLDVAMDIG